MDLASMAFPVRVTGAGGRESDSRRAQTRLVAQHIFWACMPALRRKSRRLGTVTGRGRKPRPLSHLSGRPRSRAIGVDGMQSVCRGWGRDWRDAPTTQAAMTQGGLQRPLPRAARAGARAVRDNYVRGGLRKTVR